MGFQAAFHYFTNKIHRHSHLCKNDGTLNVFSGCFFTFCRVVKGCLKNLIAQLMMQFNDTFRQQLGHAIVVCQRAFAFEARAAW